MFDINKYPLLSILIPLLCGMIGASYCINVIKWNKWLALIAILILGIVTTISYLQVKKKALKAHFFTISFSLLFTCIGVVICLHSVDSIRSKYGSDWRYAIYKDNPFQLESANKIQRNIHNWYQANSIKGEEGAIIEAITIGVKENIPKTTKSYFSRAGVSHILALSGFHISIIYILLQCVFLSRIVTYRWKWISNLLVILCLWIYAFVSGMSPSLVRSVLMCTILIIGTLHTNELISLNGLALSALIMLCINPLLIFHAGFQLSYLSMIGIYLLGIPLCRLYDSYTFIDNFLWCTICITISCSIVTLPIVSHIFGQIATISIFTNIIITILMYIFFVVFILWLITSAYLPITFLMLNIADYMVKTTKYISNLPLSTINFRFSTIEMILYYSILSIILILLKDKFKISFSFHVRS